MSTRALHRTGLVVLLFTACGPEGADVDAGDPARDAGVVSVDAGLLADAGGRDDGGVVDAGASTDAGAPSDAGFGDVDAGFVSDAGSSADAGADVDAGTVVDAGSLEDAGLDHDAGSMADAGVVSDAGVVADAGQTSDAGVVLDAGAVDAGPLDAGLVDAGPADAGLAALNDEFDSVQTTSAWFDLYPAKHNALNIDTSRAGWLTMVPVAQNFTGWYSEYEGPLFYKPVTGDFVVETSLVLGSTVDRTSIPTLSNSYAQGGFVIRDASSVTFNQRWIMYNFGFQDIAVAREIKTTVPSTNGTTDSLSTLNLNDVPGSVNVARLRVCRLGSVFRFFHRHPAEAQWVEETFRTTGTSPTRVFGNGPHPSRADNSALSFDRPDLASTLQVGLYVGNYAPPLNGVRGEFDYVRFAEASTPTDCVRDF